MYRTISKKRKNFVAYFSLVILGQSVLFVGCSQSFVNRHGLFDSIQSQTPDLSKRDSPRRASAAATPVLKSGASKESQRGDIQTVAHDQPLNGSTDNSSVTNALAVQTTPFTYQESSRRIPSQMLPVSTMQPVAMNGVPNGQRQTMSTASYATPLGNSGTVGCGGKCCSPQQGYAPLFPQFSTSGDPSYGTSYSTGCSTGCGSCNTCQAPLPSPARYVDPQEYVYDGGDRDPQARLRKDLSVEGLDSEDTVIRYETQGGSVELQTGCRVPIYSPRFSSIRKIASLNLSEHYVATQATLLDQKPNRVADALPPTKIVRRDKPAREESVKVVEAFRDRNRGIPVEKILPAIDISDAFKPYEDLAIIRIGEFRLREKAALKKGTQAALVWTSVEQLVVLVDNKAAHATESLIGPEELFNYELGNYRVRLCKVASHQVAEPGDVIDFTIRFDNTGEQKISNIMIQDSLSPRLEYVADSQKTSLKSAFTMEGNDVGSSTLTWKIEETVAPGSGGFIRFQCKVR